MPNLKQMAQAYNQFQHNFGADNPQNYDEILETLFHPSLKKITNGVELVKSREFLVPQLEKVREIAGYWIVECLKIISTAEREVIHYLLSTEKRGIFEVILILSFKEKKISLIEEIYYQKN